MTDTRICHICQNEVGAQSFCPTCTEWVATLPDPADMTPDERVSEMLLWGDILEIEFGLMHARIEALVGRSIWTHEFIYMDALIEEARIRAEVSDEQAVTIALDRIPEKFKGKVIVVDQSDTDNPVKPLEDLNSPDTSAFDDMIDGLDIE